MDLSTHLSGNGTMVAYGAKKVSALGLTSSNTLNGSFEIGMEGTLICLAEERSPLACTYANCHSITISGTSLITVVRNENNNRAIDCMDGLTLKNNANVIAVQECESSWGAIGTALISVNDSTLTAYSRNSAVQKGGGGTHSDEGYFKVFNSRISAAAENHDVSLNLDANNMGHFPSVTVEGDSSVVHLYGSKYAITPRSGTDRDTRESRWTPINLSDGLKLYSANGLSEKYADVTDQLGTQDRSLKVFRPQMLITKGSSGSEEAKRVYAEIPSITVEEPVPGKKPAQPVVTGSSWTAPIPAPTISTPSAPEEMWSSTCTSTTPWLQNRA